MQGTTLQQPDLRQGFWKQKELSELAPVVERVKGPF